MANFISPQNRNYFSTLQFTSLASNAINQFACAKGERAGFRLLSFTDYETGLTDVISFIYDCSSGRAVYLTAINIQIDTDLTGGLFSSGVFASDNNFDENTIFEKVNY